MTICGASRRHRGLQVHRDVLTPILHARAIARWQPGFIFQTETVA